MGVLTPAQMGRGLALQLRGSATLGEVLLSQGMITESDLLQALSRQTGCEIVDLHRSPPDPALVDAFGAVSCVQRGIVPWQEIDGRLLVATDNPDHLQELLADVPIDGQIRPVLALRRDIEAALLRVRGRILAEHSEHRLAPEFSFRAFSPGRMRLLLLLAVFSIAAMAVVWSEIFFSALFGWAVFALFFNTGLKLWTLAAAIGETRARQEKFASKRHMSRPFLLPKVSILVPLFQEREIAGRLLRRLSLLRYPRELLDICLVLEEDDVVTQRALAQAGLPGWIRQVFVPTGAVRTKPRALNFALGFCRGSIIGIFDAEDAPAPDQIAKVVRRFHEGGPKLGCLQGVLDFYNARQNWLTRCFALDYASWFRVMLPGLQALGLVMPLGGTTVFLRRAVLEEVGGWDAHNVTEDADLGVRLARHGYRTELVPSVTQEEAVSQIWPWVRQRTRWLKGYAITWAVHMRHPVRLFHDLGPWRFGGFQVLFLGTLSQFILAPLLWSFWSLPLGFSHPFAKIVSPQVLSTVLAAFLLAEITTLAVGYYGQKTRAGRPLWPWLPTLHLYFPLATLAAYRALWELFARPLFWDKTAHGRASRPDQP